MHDFDEHVAELALHNAGFAPHTHDFDKHVYDFAGHSVGRRYAGDGAIMHR